MSLDADIDAHNLPDQAAIRTRAGFGPPKAIDEAAIEMQVYASDYIMRDQVSFDVTKAFGG